MILKYIQENLVKVAVILIVIGLCLSFLGFASSGFDYDKFNAPEPKPWYRTITF